MNHRAVPNSIHNGRAGWPPDRLPGTYFRALAALFLEGDRGFSRQSMARELQRRLSKRGIRYHERTLRRQLSGGVFSVPPAVQKAMCGMLIKTGKFESEKELARVVRELGMYTPDFQQEQCHISTKIVAPLMRLWLYLNPSRSQRSLAESLREDLQEDGVSYSLTTIQAILAGSQMFCRREIRTVLFKYLKEAGIASEAEAKRRLESHGHEIRLALESREMVDPGRFLQLSRLWALRNRQASTRRLAFLLRDRLRERGVSLHPQHLQRLLQGKARRVRRIILDALEEELCGESQRPGALDAEIAKLETRWTDLCWVRAAPIADLARVWLSENSHVSKRQLCFKILKSIRRRGYSYSVHTIYSNLSGWKKKTRGFVYRATLRQVGRRSVKIPEEHLIGSQWDRHVDAEEPRPPLNRLFGLLSKNEYRPPTRFGSYLEEAREYLAHHTYSEKLLHLIAHRIERKYGIPWPQAESLLTATNPEKRMDDTP